MILSTGRSTTSRNASATLAFHQHRQALQDDGDDAAERANIVKIAVERVDAKFRARLVIEVAKSFGVLGPTRESRPEAIKDGSEMGKAFVAEGAAGARRVAQRLEQTRWTPKEIESADERELDVFVFKGKEAANLKQKLIPPGEGWVRYDEEMLVNPQSQVYFAQVGRQRGQYFRRNATTQKFEEASVPHSSMEFPISTAAASASCVRKGGKLDRAVLLNDIAKIARLALKFPLSFVDQPACAYALFQGLRGSESAQWCAENFHKKLLPLLAEKIHTYERRELQDVLAKTLEALDAEILRSSHAFSGCSALLALVLGDKLVVAGVGRVRAVLLPDKGRPKQLLTCTGDPSDPREFERMEQVGVLVRDGTICHSAEGFDDASRILAARHAFDVLQIEDGGPADEKQVRSAYRRLALRVHPDKQGEATENLDAFKRAFARLEGAKEAIETMLGEDAECCREIHRVLRSDVHTRAGAAALLGVNPAATLDTAVVTVEAEKACKALLKRLGKLQQVALEHHDRAAAAAKEAVATIQRGCTEEALPRYEAQLRDGLSTSRTMGARDLRMPHPIALMQPETASQFVPLNGRFRLALLCGATAALPDDQLAQATAHLARQPKASALRWCLNSDPAAASSSAVCIALEAAKADEVPAKRQRIVASNAGPEGTVRVRHILLRHQQLRQPDPMARREGTARGAQEAEAAALAALEQLLKDPNQFGRICRELSDCQTATQPGKLAGDMGWLGRGQQEQSFEDVVFALPVNAFGDLVTTSRGVHVLQRLA
mmetsp:Transcript_102026/g.304421  ORF Transcript_102026/g.304421 Transcript_102026/m.304421 type:complete len:778 (+) Transcript_102026:86-2419(+)